MLMNYIHVRLKIFKLIKILKGRCCKNAKDNDTKEQILKI